MTENVQKRNFTEEEMCTSTEQKCPVPLTFREIAKIISHLELNYHFTLSGWPFQVLMKIQTKQVTCYH